MFNLKLISVRKKITLDFCYMGIATATAANATDCFRIKIAI